MLYAIGDIHGQIARLEEALALIEADGGSGAKVVFVGDYTDRGPESNAVVETLMRGVAEGRNWTVLRGNHDRMFTRFVRGGVVDDDRISSGKGWLHPALGGRETLLSYGVAYPDDIEELRDGPLFAAILGEAQAAVPEAHLAFLESRPLWHDAGRLRFVHAGILPGRPIEQQDEDDLIWIRKGWLDDPRDHGVLYVHGHTALDTPTDHGNRINIDGGAGYGRPLVPVAFDGSEVLALTPRGRVALPHAG